MRRKKEEGIKWTKGEGREVGTEGEGKEEGSKGKNGNSEGKNND